MTVLRTASTRPVAPALIAALFTATIFLSASLLFFVQPLFTRIALPAIGGAPAVWTTAMLFFQTVLIAGYLYSHLLTRYASVQVQIGVHLTLWALALIFLPLSLPGGWLYDAQKSAVMQTLTLYAFGVGLPFAVLSANSPLIQSWYAKSDGPSANDPYFLYGASNLGSLIALLAFPLVAEPLFGARAIGQGWAWGFVALGGFLLVSGLQVRRSTTSATAQSKTQASPDMRVIAKWLLLAFIPSSLMLGVTTKIGTDLGSFPLLWVGPLALYLLTFVITFTNKPLIGRGPLKKAFMASLVLMVALASGLWAESLTWTMSGLLILCCFVVTLMAHQKLYDARPSQGHLTLFYVIMSVGGAIGGLFNSIFAPLLLNDFYELRITVAVAALLLLASGSKLRPKDAAFGIVTGLIALLPLSLGQTILKGSGHSIIAVAVIVALLSGLWISRNRGYAVVTAVMTTMIGAGFASYEPSIFRDRSFFGPHRVVDRDSLRLYANGTTFHGAERIKDLTAERPSPMAYYHEGAPMGQILSSVRGQAARTVGIVGLGVGALACYKNTNQDWHFYEIDQKVNEIARNPNLFTFMSNCAGNSPTHLGDARIVLDQQKDLRFDILVIDAYSSDTVPIHLSTVEALQLYRDRLNPDGIIVFHISNRYYEIEKVLSRSAEALGMKGLLQNQTDTTGLENGLFPSKVMVIGADDAALGDLTQDPRWVPVPSDGGRLWTDDYANLLSILK